MKVHNDKTRARIAVIYCRVSSAAQVTKGHGNDSQETRCRQFAAAKNYAVERVFVDEAVSGSLIDRPGIQDMLKYLRAHKRDGDYVVVIDDISRLARDIRAHIELRSAIAATGATLESPSIEFGEDSDAQLVEHLLASVSQHQREKNAEQTRNRMGARLSAGYWPFAAPIAYRYGAAADGTRILVRREPIASALQEALQLFASGHLQTQSEMKRFLECSPDFPKSKKGLVRNTLVPELLANPVYAGYVEKLDWGVPLSKGRHEGLISFEDFQRIQRRLKEGARAPTRTDVSADFPLRGAVACTCCGKSLTSCWSTSKTGAKHPYYMCFQRGCTEYRKSIRRAKIEGDFAHLLERLTPAPKLLKVTLAMFKDAWGQRRTQAVAVALAYEREVAQIEKQIGVLLDRILDASSQSVVAAYEKRIGSLERSKIELTEKRGTVGARHGTFEELFELAIAFLANPSKLWLSGELTYQKLVLRLTFADRLAYSQLEGFSNPKTTMPFSMLGGISGGGGRLAERMGFEPTRPF